MIACELDDDLVHDLLSIHSVREVGLVHYKIAKLETRGIEVALNLS